jgi:hypothetical protein
MAFVRHLDYVLLAAMLPVFLLAGLPVAGWVAGGGVYLAQKALAAWMESKAAAAEEVRTRVGLMTGSLIARGWFVALTIFAVGIGIDEDAGLAAAVVFLALFTVSFTLTLVLRPFDQPPGTP